MPTKILDWRMKERTPYASQQLPCICSRCCTHSVSNNANGVACSQTGQANRQTSTHVHEASKQRVLLLRRGLDVAGDQDGNDESVDGQDTGHDDGDKGLQQQSV
jgi:hypothetical protein